MFIFEDEKIAHQLSRVLRIQKGEKIVFFNGSGFDFVMRVDKLSPRFVSGKIVGAEKNAKDPEIEVHLYQSFLRKEKFEWVLEKGTELGVKFFHPVIAERSVKVTLNMARCRSIVKEATEQSEQDRVPQICEAVKFLDAVKEADGNAINVLCDPGGKSFDTGMLKRARKIGERINLFVGPANGFTEREIGEAKIRECAVLSLGPRILRAETAAILVSGFLLLDA